MRVQSAMLCEAASIENGKLFLLGAGLARWWLPAFPGVARPVLAMVIEADRDLDQGAAHFTVRASAVGGTELVRGELVVEIKGPDLPGWPWIIPFVTPVEVPVQAPGPIDLTVSGEAGVDVRIPLMVTAPPA